MKQENRIRNTCNICNVIDLYNYTYCWLILFFFNLTALVTSAGEKKSCFRGIINMTFLWNIIKINTNFTFTIICIDKLFMIRAEQTYLYTIIVFISAVKRINHIQNKSFCLHNVFVLCIYFFVYINTNTCKYIYNKIYVYYIYIYIYIYNKI